ncbi:hypothetical protein UPYG_G00111770 [Umbra pygmaea]|uniref:Uncharacterized protein n=1 Tax=Umbra pygmaea TaxID=75934 RepID=A0ABD0X356_UMBPY
MEVHCQHAPLNSDQRLRKKWLDPDSVAFEELCSVVRDRCLLKDPEKIALFKHTGELEVFHSAMLKYKNVLGNRAQAVIHHKENLGRKQAVNAAGTANFRVKLVEYVLKSRLDPTTASSQLVQLALPKNIAPVPKPTGQEALDKHMSHFKSST